MPRTATIKNIKQHTECSCGMNSVEDSQMIIAAKKLKGYTRRKYKDTGERFYFIQIKVMQCDSCDPM